MRDEKKAKELAQNSMDKFVQDEIHMNSPYPEVQEGLRKATEKTIRKATGKSTYMKKHIQEPDVEADKIHKWNNNKNDIEKLFEGYDGGYKCSEIETGNSVGKEIIQDSESKEWRTV